MCGLIERLFKRGFCMRVSDPTCGLLYPVIMTYHGPTIPTEPKRLPDGFRVQRCENGNTTRTGTPPERDSMSTQVPQWMSISRRR